MKVDKVLPLKFNFLNQSNMKITSNTISKAF